eukprot:gene19276-6543_t
MDLPANVTCDTHRKVYGPGLDSLGCKTLGPLPWEEARMARYTGQTSPYIVYINNNRKDVISNMVRSTGAWLGEDCGRIVMLLTRVWREIDKRVKGLSRTYVDIGANVGFLSLVALHNDFKVIAFEPFPANYHLLRRNLCAYKSLADNATIYPYGAYPHEAECK